MANENINNSDFYSVQEELQTKITKIEIDDGFTEISSNTFCDFSILTEVILPNTIINIGSKSFMNCSVLSYINFPEEIIKIDDNAFRNTGLKQFNVPKKLNKLGANVFKDCTNLKSVNLESDNLESIGNGCFENCENLIDIKLPNHLEQIPDSCFRNCTKLKNIKLPDNLKNIGKSAFSYTGLSEIIIPNSVITIGVNAFRYATNSNNDELNITFENNRHTDLNISNIIAGDINTITFYGTNRQFSQIKYKDNPITIENIPADSINKIEKIIKVIFLNTDNAILSEQEIKNIDSEDSNLIKNSIFDQNDIIYENMFSEDQNESNRIILPEQEKIIYDKNLYVFNNKYQISADKENYNDIKTDETTNIKYFDLKDFETEKYNAETDETTINYIDTIYFKPKIEIAEQAKIKIYFDYTTNYINNIEQLSLTNITNLKFDNQSNKYYLETLPDTIYSLYENGIESNKGAKNVSEDALNDIKSVSVNGSNNYEFVGWNINKSQTNGLAEIETETEDIVLYAIYKHDIEFRFNYKQAVIPINTIYRTIYNKQESVSITINTYIDDYVETDENGKQYNYKFTKWRVLDKYSSKISNIRYDSEYIDNTLTIKQNQLADDSTKSIVISNAIYTNTQDLIIDFNGSDGYIKSIYDTHPISQDRKQTCTWTIIYNGTNDITKNKPSIPYGGYHMSEAAFQYYEENEFRELYGITFDLSDQDQNNAVSIASKLITKTGYKYNGMYYINPVTNKKIQLSDWTGMYEIETDHKWLSNNIVSGTANDSDISAQSDVIMDSIVPIIPGDIIIGGGGSTTIIGGSINNKLIYLKSDDDNGNCICDYPSETRLFVEWIDAILPDDSVDYTDKDGNILDISNIFDIEYNHENYTAKINGFKSNLDINNINLLSVDNTFKFPEYIVVTNSETNEDNKYIFDCINVNSFNNKFDELFADTSQLKIYMPNSYKTIGNTAFANNNCIIEINIPDNLSEFNYFTFNCQNLNNYIISNNMEFIFDSDNCCLVYKSGNINELIAYTGTEEEYIVPDYITSLSSYCFSGNKKIKTIIIPRMIFESDDNTKQYLRINGDCITDCNNLSKIIYLGTEDDFDKIYYSESIDMKDKITYMDNIDIDMFKYSLNPIDKTAKILGFRDNISMTEEYATELTCGVGTWLRFDIPNNVTCFNTNYTITSIANNAFEEKIDSFTNAIHDIENYNNQNTITQLFIPNTIIDIGEKAFNNNKNIFDVVWDEDMKLKTINQFTFGQTGITNIVIPDSVTTIKGSAFTLHSNYNNMTITINIEGPDYDDYIKKNGSLSIELKDYSITINSLAFVVDTDGNNKISDVIINRLKYKATLDSGSNGAIWGFVNGSKFKYYEYDESTNKIKYTTLIYDSNTKEFKSSIEGDAN